MVWTVGVDVGGTFTDFFAVDESNGSVHVGKFPSTPGNPAEAVLNGLEVLAQEHGLISMNSASSRMVLPWQPTPCCSGAAVMSCC